VALVMPVLGLIVALLPVSVPLLLIAGLSHLITACRQRGSSMLSYLQRPLQWMSKWYRSPNDEYHPLAAGPEESDAAAAAASAAPQAAVVPRVALVAHKLPFQDEEHLVLEVHGVKLEHLLLTDDEKAWLLSEIRQQLQLAAQRGSPLPSSYTLDVEEHVV
jgi:hypothetical protein